MIAIHIFQAMGVVALALVAPALYLRYRLRRVAMGDRQWAVLAAIVLLAGFFLRVTAISAIAVVALVALGIGWLWRRAVLANVRYSCAIQEPRLFPGQETAVVWTLANQKWLPVPCLRWRKRVSAGLWDEKGERCVDLTGIDLRPIFDGSAYGIDQVISLGSYEAVTRTAVARACRRGVYRIGAAEIQAADMLGLSTSSRTTGLSVSIVVYPQISSLSELDVPLALLPARRTAYSWMDDPSWYRGVRQYEAGDPMKRLDWRVIARTGELQVKLFDPVTHGRLTVAAYLHSFEQPHDGRVQPYMERIISVAASVAYWSLDAGLDVELVANAQSQGEPLQVAPIVGPDQGPLILERIAYLDRVLDRSLEQTLEMRTESDAEPSTLAVCAGIVTDAMAATLVEVAQRQRVVLIMVDSDVVPRLANVEVVSARSSGEAAA